MPGVPASETSATRLPERTCATSSCARVRFVVLVIADGRGADVEMVQQLLRVAGVFAGDELGCAEDMERAQGDVVEVADGRGDEV